MSTWIYCYSGGGSSFWAAREIARRLPGGALIKAVRLPPEPTSARPEADRIGFVFPVYAWAPPRRLIDFVRTLDLSGFQNCFAVVTHAGQPAAALPRLAQAVKESGGRLTRGFALRMPSSFGRQETAAKIHEHLNEAQKRVAEDIVPALVNTGADSDGRDAAELLETGSLWQRTFLSALNPACAPFLGKMCRRRLDSAKCKKCGVCADLCPAGSIRMTDTGPVFDAGCDACGACFTWCPEGAIRGSPAGKDFVRRRPSHVSLADFRAFARSSEGVRVDEEKAAESAGNDACSPQSAEPPAT